MTVVGDLLVPHFEEDERSSRSASPTNSPTTPAISRSASKRHITQSIRERADETRNRSVLVDKYYHGVRTQILRYQSLTTGLFPRNSTGPDRHVGYVRDSIYCACACFTLSKAYKRMDDDRGREYELGQSAVKTMRGIMYCWMKQSNHLEAFKHNPCPTNALHSKFKLDTGEPVVSSEEYGHLQIDVVSLYLIMLVQFIAGDLQIIFSPMEVAFIQNLVFYIERAYRTPDYGMWECGTRYSDGSCELQASSLGMVKAALEAISGFNLYGNRVVSGSVIYVDVDAHNRNRTTFETLLPRESNSKNTDAALIATVSFPAFATHKPSFISSVMDKATRKLKGKYGFRRFLRDGYGTAIHDRTRRFYKPGETKLFDGIECQWPMFFLYMIIDGIFNKNSEQVREYRRALEPLLIHSANGFIVPEYFYCPEELLNAERLNPGAIHFAAGSAGDADIEDSIFLWGQSLFTIAGLLAEQIVTLSEVDVIHRHMPTGNRPTATTSHSAFQGSTSDPVCQIALISESTRLQALLSTYGIQTQTPHQVEPVQIWPSGELVYVFESLGRVPELGLSGRPPRPLGALSTSKVYRVFGETVLCYPLLFEVSDFYMAADPSIIIDDIKKTLEFVVSRWKLAGRPIVVGLLREAHISGDRFSQVLNLLTMFKSGDCDGTRVRLGPLQNLISASPIEQLDFLGKREISKYQADDIAGKLEIRKYQEVVADKDLYG